MPKIALETDILRTRHSSGDFDSDEWPEFGLTNGTVHLRDNSKTIASLLHATEHNALVVTGQLEPLPKHLTHLLKKPSALRRTEHIELPAVRLYAYGQYSDGSIAIWAAGQAGWFGLKPSRAYRAVYNDMVEAIETLYFIADAYKEEQLPQNGKSKKAAGMRQYSAQEIFVKYAMAKLQDEARSMEAAERIYRHKEFLFMSMSVGKEGVAWTNTPFWRHLVAKFPAEYAAVKAKLKAEEPSNTATTAVASGPRAARSESVNSESSSLKRKRGRPPKHRPADVISVDSSTATTASGFITTIWPNRQPSAAGPGSVHAWQPHSRKTATRATTWRSTSGEPERVAFSTPVHDSEDEPSPRVHRGKSILRPKSAKSSKSSKMRRRVVSGDEEEAAGRAEDATPGSPTVGKRKSEAEHEDWGHLRKNRSSRQDPEDEGIDIPSSASESSSPPTSPPLIPESIKSPTNVLHELDPVQEDTWVCALDGCTHKVYLASEPDSQRLIREHYALHAYDDDERVQMVKRLKAPSLPVSHLMERVRLQAKNEGFPSSRTGAVGPSGDRFPNTTSTPVMQRY